MEATAAALELRDLLVAADVITPKTIAIGKISTTEADDLPDDHWTLVLHAVGADSPAHRQIVSPSRPACETAAERAYDRGRRTRHQTEGHP
jgi:hypothetical protein